MNPRLKSLQAKVKHLPEQPGVYLMKNAAGKIIYVGKAKNLRSRVRSYFTSIDKHEIKTRKLVEEIDEFDIILTKTEMEALFTERTLIRHNSPYYNILLRDDKEFPFIRVDFNEDWPRLEKVRRRKEDGAKYYGPFGNPSQLALLIKSIGRIFPIIRCSRHEFKNTKRPCNYYHMKMCYAPCVLDEISSDAYKEMIRNALLVLEGKSSEIKNKLEELMKTASDSMQFELAAKYRDQIQALTTGYEKQTVVVKSLKDADVVQCVEGDEEVCFMILMIREYKLAGSDHFVVNKPAQDEREALTSFLVQYYDGHYLPAELVLPFAVEDEVASFFEQTSERKHLQITVPSIGDKKKLLEMAEKNAKYQLEEAKRTRSGYRSSLEILQKTLKLDKFPRRMECIDISNMQGQAIVASDVCFIDGRPAKEQYRLYNIKTVTDKNDDFASIEEVVERRIKRGIELFDLPDLLIIDGGKGQLNAALASLKKFPDLNINVVSIAKSRVQKIARSVQTNEVERSFERVFIPGEEQPTVLTPGGPEFRLMTQIRDEAHRFAIQNHRRKRKANLFSSELDAIPGVGPVAKRRLIEHFGQIEQIKAANVDQLKKAPGVSEKLALQVFRWFRDSDG